MHSTFKELQLQHKETEHGDFHHDEFDDKSRIQHLLDFQLSWMDFFSLLYIYHISITVTIWPVLH